MYKFLSTQFAVYGLTISAILIGILAFSGCGGSKQVTRVDADTTIDLSGRWNDTDSRMVADEIIGDCLSHPWINDHGINTGGKPVVIVGGIRNKSMEHIPVATFITDIERAFINSGKVRTVSGSSERGEIREERADQGEFAALETVKRMGRELGADYMMTGEINTIEDREGGDQVVFYQTDLTLTNIETNEKIWIGNKKIKKFIGRDKFKL
ncbi:penicillin-binding protein activator LpoB [Candidatus Poribacteria bacterium]|nr:MAG: penicillin-binding protein activator LpoB [Candidatus Poribacteria bacterium]